MTIEIRKCKASDVAEVVPLMYSSGLESFRYVFSVDYEEQAVDFLHHAFCCGDGEFGYKDHQVVIEGGCIIALVGRRIAKDNLKYTMAAIKQIFGYYGFYKGVGVLVRGLRFEAIVAPPVKDVVCLHNLAVSLEQRGAGIGAQLIKSFLTQEKERGSAVVSLNVAETNPRAKVLYEKLGFVVKNKKVGKLSSKFGRGVSHEYMEISL